MNEPAARDTHPAGFWIRLLAFAIDAVVIALAQLVLQVIAVARLGADAAPSAAGFFTLVFAVAYPTVLHAIAGQTIGKLLTRVRIVALDGGALPLGAALLRAVVFWVTLPLLFGVGHIVGGLRKDKRAFHDLLAGSRAERLPSLASAPPVLREAARVSTLPTTPYEPPPPPPPESERRFSG
jgi:uncharacterized RDD family membrane protein YckC